MRYTPGCALISLGAASSVAALVAVLEAPVAANPAMQEHEPVSVNRMFKGDRAPSLPGASRVIHESPVHEPSLPEGCVAAAEWRSNVYYDEIPGRCVV